MAPADTEEPAARVTAPTVPEIVLTKLAAARDCCALPRLARATSMLAWSSANFCAVTALVLELLEPLPAAEVPVVPDAAPVDEVPLFDPDPVEPAADDPVPVDDEPPEAVVTRKLSFSASSLNAYAECARKWWFRYACAAVEDRGSSASFYGIAFHAALEDFHAVQEL